MTDRDTENLTVPFEQAHGERRKIDIVQVAHLSAQKVGPLRLLHAHGDVAVRNIIGTINAVTAPFALKAHVFVGKDTLFITAVLQGRLALTNGIEFADECTQSGALYLVDLPDRGAQFVIVVRIVPFSTAF